MTSAAPTLHYGCSPAAAVLPGLFERWAALPYEILLLGETGTGKSVVAAHLHALSGRSGPFTDCSLAQLPEQTAVSELFGHVRGAFTDAVSDRMGHVEAARGGTLCLDELGDCPRRVQGMLLKALETKQIQRLGENRLRDVDFRLIAATNADLEALAVAGEFREDLLARFGDYVIRLPPLRERRDEIVPLARSFLQLESRVAGRAEPPLLSGEVERLLTDAPWRYNIRGLRSLCRYLVGNAGPVAHPFDLPPSFARSVGLSTRDGGQSVAARARRVLGEVGGNKARAARRLGISRTHLYRVLKQPTVRE